LKVYSEFQRIDPFGEVVHIDRTERHREILSPAAARNAHISFHLAVTIPEGVPSFLYVQQNPEHVNVTMYKELFVRTKEGWIPDGLEKVEIPYFLILPGQSPIPKQNTLVFCMDVWVPSETPVERMRLEAVLKSGGQWIVYPMELRVMAAVAPAIRWAPGPVPPLTARADVSLAGPLRTLLCGAREKGSTSALTVRQLIRRNVLEDVALARKLGVKQEILRRLEPSWCELRDAPSTQSPEWYLPLRSFLIQKANVLEKQNVPAGSGNSRRSPSQ
jgi:hypothetical protein